jgi:hypothetical protein
MVGPNKNTYRTEIWEGTKKLYPREGYKYLDIHVSYDIKYKIGSANLKKKYFRGLWLVLGTELSANNKIQEIEWLAVPVNWQILGLLTDFKQNCKY